MAEIGVHKDKNFRKYYGYDLSLGYGGGISFVRDSDKYGIKVIK